MKRLCCTWTFSLLTLAALSLATLSPAALRRRRSSRPPWTVRA